jgi:Uri superfamily endonuclease
MAKGIYALIIDLTQDATITVGALGETHFKEGTYVYVGSAQANLEQRVKRHLRKEKRLHWHIDYLLSNPHAKITNVLYLQGDKSAECKTAQQVRMQGEPVQGFGCSDCHCASHCFLVAGSEFLGEFMEPLVRVFPSCLGFLPP